MGELIAGLMWWNNDPKKALTVKVEEAANYFRSKYGVVADTCLVNRAMATEPESVLVIAGGTTITIKPHRSILPDHLWIGVAEKETGHEAQKR